MTTTPEWPLAETCDHNDLNMTPEEFARVKACWNACAGISTDELEQKTGIVASSIDAAVGLVDLAADQLDTAIRQRDQLLAAAKQAAAEIRRCDYTPARSTLLVAIDAVEQPKPAADGWIEWSGGERPVADGAIIWIRFRDGDECPAGSGKGLTWEHEGDAGDIIAYRVLQEGA